MKKYLLILLFYPMLASAQQPMYYNLATGKYVVYGLSSDTKPVSPPDNCYFVEINTADIYLSSSGTWSLCPINAVTQTALNTKQATLVSATNIKTVNGSSLLGAGDIAISGTAAWGSVTGTLGDQTDLINALNLKAPLASPTFTGTVGGVTATMVGLGSVSNNAQLTIANNLSDLNNAATARTNIGLGNVTNESKATMFTSPTFTGTTSGITSTMVGLGNVTNESKATMFTSPTFTGTPVVPSAITVGGNTITFPAVAATLLPNTSTADIGTSPTASSTTTITHNLGRVPTIIRIYGYGTFTANAASTATTSSMGTFNSSGNRCVYQRYGAAITTTQAGLTSNTFAILLATGGGSFISGVIQNVTSTQFDIVWTETGTATAQPYLWEAQ